MRFLSIFTLLFSFVSHAQTNQNILIFLPDTSNVDLDSCCIKIIKNHNQSISQFKSYILETFDIYANSLLISESNQVVLQNENESRESEITKSDFLFYMLENPTEIEFINTQYTALPKDYSLVAQKALLSNNQIDKIILITKIKTSTKRPFNQKTFLKVSYKLYDQSLIKTQVNSVAYGMKLHNSLDYKLLEYFARTMIYNEIQFKLLPTILK